VLRPPPVKPELPDRIVPEGESLVTLEEPELATQALPRLSIAMLYGPFISGLVKPLPIERGAPKLDSFETVFQY
jgi:hypothetical protein